MEKDDPVRGAMQYEVGIFLGGCDDDIRVKYCLSSTVASVRRHEILPAK